MLKQNNIPDIIQLGAQQHRPLVEGMIHVYVMPIEDLLRIEAELLAYINADEEARANRFIRHDDGRHYRCIRGMLRKLLAFYLNCAPAGIEFSYAEHGKPSLQAHPQLQFNLSHSRDMAAFAFNFEHEVGVDIEYMRAQKDLAGMIRHVASKKEQAELQALNDSDAYQAFYRLWTRKEAFIKAVGRGLGMGLRSIHIGTHETTEALAVEYKNQIQPMWFVSDLQAPQDYRLAICSQYLGG